MDKVKLVAPILILWPKMEFLQKENGLQALFVAK
jgi:hypothetical protein